jgi:hypothetical protein
MDNMFLHGKIFVQERKDLSSEENIFSKEINFDPFSQKKVPLTEFEPATVEKSG